MADISNYKEALRLLDEVRSQITEPFTQNNIREERLDALVQAIEAQVEAVKIPTYAIAESFNQFLDDVNTCWERDAVSLPDMLTNWDVDGGGLKIELENGQKFKVIFQEV